MKKIRITFWILVLFSLFISCKIQNEQNYIIKELKNYNKIDLEVLIKQEYDFLIVLDEGATLKQYDIYEDVESNWLGQKIIFFKNNKIIKQINLDYYISKPDKKYYLSFFDTDNPNSCYIKRTRDDSVFNLKNVEEIGINPFCYFVE